MDTEGLLKLLNENKVDYVVIGATAFPVHGYARATLDIDIFVRPELDNIKRVKKTLTEFGYDLTDISYQDLLNKNLVRFAHNWNDGMLEYWNNGLAPFGQIYACGGDGWEPEVLSP